MLKKVLNVVNYIFGSLFNLAVAVALVIGAYTVTIWAFDFGQGVFGEDNYEYRELEYVTVEIPEDASGMDIARILREHELIGNEWMFHLNAVLNGSANHFLRGMTFELNTGMNDSMIMHTLQRIPEGLQADGTRISIMEGLTNWQIADLAATLGHFTAQEFLYELEEGSFTNFFLRDIEDRPNRLEGFLFPDTYYLPQNPTPRDLIVRMLAQFGEIFTGEMLARIDELSEAFGMELTIEDIVIIASIVEREAVVQSDRPMVAAMIYNRLAAGMPLEMVTTVVYATNTRMDMLTAADFQVNSPYNTFNRHGLPIGPISNPGFNAINATLYPANVDYLFKVINDYETRSYYFTASHEDYIAAQERYRSDNIEEIDGDEDGDE
ncbi:MAG: endolytic transglycosylase MltG [Defluviitaleaceae bacterium]|nr:endolytic transglycosylase MltG [Defluviitaleaceae bacterium]